MSEKQMVYISKKNKRESLIAMIKAYKVAYKTPFVIEISGTPNSGKTSAINSFKRTLTKNRISYNIIFEQANNCKIEDKLSENFNIWTACNTISKLLETINKDYDIVICERGIFDALCWCKFHKERNKLKNNEYQKMVEYYSLDKFTSIPSILVLFTCSDSISVEREHYSSLYPEMQGRIVNSQVIKELNSSISETKKLFGNRFRDVVEIDTSDMKQEDINDAFTEKIFERIEQMDI